MIKSMTGYGRAQGSFSGGDITAEVKSVNNRYLDCGVKLPRGYAYLEEGVKSQVQKAISRGKVDVFITINAAGADNVKISVNEPVAKGYIDAMHRLVQEYGIQDDISASAISKFSDVFLVEKQEQDENEVKSAISGVVAEALSAFDAMRTREGEALKTDLLQKAEGILTLVSKVEERSPITVKAYRERLTAKMQEVLEDRQIDGLRDENGSVKPEYKVCLDVYGHEKELGHHVVCIGGSETAIETAMYLAENGHDVTLLTRQDELAKDASHLHYITMAWIKTEPDGRTHMAPAWEKYEGIKGILNATTVKVEGNTVTYIQDGVEKTVSGDSVMISGGMNPNVDEALTFAGIVPKFYVIGDANRDGNIQRGMRDAFSKAMLL